MSKTEPEGFKNKAWLSRHSAYIDCVLIGPTEPMRKARCSGMYLSPRDGDMGGRASQILTSAQAGLVYVVKF